MDDVDAVAADNMGPNYDLEAGELTVTRGTRHHG